MTMRIERHRELVLWAIVLLVSLVVVPGIAGGWMFLLHEVLL